MVNTAIDKYRKKTSEPTMLDADENINIKSSDNVLSNLERDDIIKCINKLPHGYRTILNLYAEKLGISEGTSKSQLYKAKQYLKSLVEKYYSYYNE